MSVCVMQIKLGLFTDIQSYSAGYLMHVFSHKLWFTLTSGEQHVSVHIIRPSVINHSVNMMISSTWVCFRSLITQGEMSLKTNNKGSVFYILNQYLFIYSCLIHLLKCNKIMELNILFTVRFFCQLWFSNLLLKIQMN